MNKRVITSLVLILFGLIVGGIIIFILGANPFATYVSFLQGSGLLPKANYAGGKNMLADLSSLVNYWTPMIFASLSVAVAYKGGLFNIGVPGMMLMGGFLSTVIVGYSMVSAPIAKITVVLISMVAGALIGVIIGFLKYKFNIHEVVSSVMINYILQYVFAFFINTKIIDPISRQSKEVGANARLSLMDTDIGGIKYDIPLGFALALIAVILIGFLFNRTILGYEIKAIGGSKTASKYGGINVSTTIIKIMAISGILGGLAGATYYLGYLGSIQPKVVPQMGYDAIAVSLLGNSSPTGVLAASFLISVIGRGRNYMSSVSGLDIEIAHMLTAILLLFSACVTYFQAKIIKQKFKGG